KNMGSSKIRKVKARRKQLIPKGRTPTGIYCVTSLAPVSTFPSVHIAGTCSGSTVFVIIVQAHDWDSFQVPSSKTNSTFSAVCEGSSGTVKLTVAKTESGE